MASNRSQFSAHDSRVLRYFVGRSIDGDGHDVWMCDLVEAWVTTEAIKRCVIRGWLFEFQTTGNVKTLSWRVSPEGWNALARFESNRA